jgi:hypothetical protein
MSLYDKYDKRKFEIFMDLVEERYLDGGMGCVVLKDKYLRYRC